MWTKRLPSGDGRGADPGPPPGSPCSRLPSVRTIRSWPSAVSRTTWNQPSASETNRREPSGSQRAATSTLRSPATTRDAPVATSTRAIWAVSSISGPRRAMTAIRAPSGDHSNASTSMPISVRTVGRGGFGSVAGRPRRGTGASISQICDQPRRRDRNARRCPSGDQRGSRPAPGLATTRVRRDPSASMTQISSSRTNARRRPSGDHCGSETGFSEAVSWLGYPPRNASVKSCRAPAVSAVNATRRSRGWRRNSRGASTATIASIVRLGDGVMGAVGISARPPGVGAVPLSTARSPRGGRGSGRGGPHRPSPTHRRCGSSPGRAVARPR